MEQDKNKKTNPFGGMRQAARAVSDFLRAGRRNEARRAAGASEDDFTDAAIEERIRKGAGGRRAGDKAVDDFWRSAYKKAKGPATQEAEKERPGDIADRIRYMSDDEFENAVKTGALTPDQVRKAGEYDWDTWMGDVWSETDWPDRVAEPTYDEFMADPAKYGYERGINEETDRSFDRYAKYGKKK